MNNFVDFKLKEKSWIFPGSIKTYSCPPEERCQTCGGNGRCTKCAGQGSVRCGTCGGRGEISCPSCSGKGQCSYCSGRGGATGVDGNWKDCYHCSGTGRCRNCGGRGTVTCYSCSGKGFEKCWSCMGSGNCITCDGSGAVTCSRCKGTGFFQIYLEYTAHYCVRQLVTPGPTPELIEGLRIAEGYELCNYVAKYWRKDNVVEFDNTERCFKKLIKDSGDYSNYAEDLHKEYTSTPEMTQGIAEYKPYMNTLRANRVQYTHVKYSLNDKEYDMIFVGTNGVVSFGDVPSSIKIFDITDIQRAYLKQTAYSRHQALAILTSYIFNLDGIDNRESEHLSLLLKHMCLDQLGRDRKVKYLKQRYTADIPDDVILDKIKCLLISKRTICYVWQCIAIDKKVSERELCFFERLVARYNISEGEVNTLKRYASKFAGLEDEQFVLEYLESPAVYRDRNYRRWIFIAAMLFISSILTLIVTIHNGDWTFAFICSFVALIYVVVKHHPFIEYDQKEINKLYKEISRYPDLTEADYIVCIAPLRVWYKIVDLQIAIVAKAGVVFDKVTLLLKKYIQKLIAKIKDAASQKRNRS